MIAKSIVGILAFIGVLASGLLIGACNVGAWNLLFPSHHHETVPPEIPQDLNEPAILVFSKTNSFRHKDGIKAGNAFFQTLAEEQELGIYQTENSAVFNPEELAGFSVVIFNNVTGDVLSESQEEAFQQWLEAGGGWLGLHGAGDDSHADWTWYVDTLIGAKFIAHIMGPQFQVASVLVDDTSHVAMQKLPPTWEHNEEWYSWEESVRDKGFNVLLSVDESTYNPHYKFLFSRKDLRMGDHPVIWNRCVGKGRSLYSALGHKGDAYNSDEYRQLLNGAMKWLLDPSACDWE